MKKYRFLLIIIIVLFIGLLIAPGGAIKPVKNIFFAVTKPFSFTGNIVADRVTMFFRNLVHLSSLAGENQKLILENLELQSKLSVLKEAQHENEILKKELGFANTQGDLKLIPANIIGRSITGFLRTIIIDRGTKNGIKSGQAVMSQGFLVGVVREVYENSSEVTLITNYNSLVPVILQDSRATGLLRGGLKGLTVEEIPLNIEVKTDERVVTSGLGGEIPPGILIGQVGEVISHEGEIFQKATVNSPVQIYYLEFVFVAQT